ncbi:hydrolase [Candidatus Bathyarchaeota archaeon]|nr:hydrolase [Candidatus Bathyarchaeota archaeon]
MSIRLLSKDEPVLIVIDVQEKLLTHIAQKETVLENLEKLIKFMHIIKIPIIITEQYPKGLGPTVPEVKSLIPDSKPIEKLEFSCFGSQEFKKALEKTGKKTLILAGIEAHICVTQTAIEGLENGYRIYVVEDATSSRTLQDKVTAINRMRQNGATIVSTEMLIYELLKKARTPEFKESLKLIK